MKKNNNIPQTNLVDLVRTGALSPGQTLYFHFNGKRIDGAEYQATVTGGKKLDWIDTDGQLQTESMTHIARQLTPRLGRSETEERGPQYWFTADGKSILELWVAHCGLVQLRDGSYLTQEELNELSEI